MAQTNYNIIIIGAGQSNASTSSAQRLTLTPIPLRGTRPKGNENESHENKKPPFSGRLGMDYAGTAMYSAEAVPLGIGSLSSNNP